MVDKLLIAQLGAVFTVDPAVALWTYVKAQWTTVTGYSPPVVSLVKFDTKFGEMKGFYNYFIVENMPQAIKPQTLGGSRYRYNDVKRVQILCVGKSAKNNKWLMEQHIDSILNGNPMGMITTYGIDEVQLTNFTDVIGESYVQITGLMPIKEYQVARSRALVTLLYDKYATAV